MDALKYFPSLNLRKRYIGDVDHVVPAYRPYTRRTLLAESAFDL